MIRVLLFLLFSLILHGRENPFFPLNGAKEISFTSNQKERIAPLKRATLMFPSTARIIKGVTVTYQNLDGSVESKKIILHNRIDWHLPLVISQSYFEREKKVTRENHKEKTNEYKKIASLSFITFYAKGKNLKIVTKDRLLRDFLLVKPHRIVCDFKRQTDIRSYIKKVSKSSFFKTIRVGTHKGYYRVVIELDGYYQYKFEKNGAGYLFTLL